MRFRNVCFTVNNPVEAKELVLARLTQHPSFSYAETAETTGTPHHQGYVEFKSQVTLTTLQRLLPGGHCEPRLGAPERAANYCKKGRQSTQEWGTMHEAGLHFGEGADFCEEGVRAAPGARTDIQAACADVVSGKRMRDIAIDHSTVSVKHFRGLQRLQEGTKGGSAQFVATQIAITSPVPPRMWYRTLEDGDRFEQLERRLSEVFDCGSLHEEEQARERLFHM